MYLCIQVLGSHLHTIVTTLVPFAQHQTDLGKQVCSCWQWLIINCYECACVFIIVGIGLAWVSHGTLPDPQDDWICCSFRPLPLSKPLQGVVWAMERGQGSHGGTEPGWGNWGLSQINQWLILIDQSMIFTDWSISKRCWSINDWCWLIVILSPLGDNTVLVTVAAQSATLFQHSLAIFLILHLPLGGRAAIPSNTLALLSLWAEAPAQKNWWVCTSK